MSDEKQINIDTDKIIEQVNSSQGLEDQELNQNEIEHLKKSIEKWQEQYSNDSKQKRK